MEKFKAPKLPTMLNGAVMCVNAEAWNSLIAYVQSLTEFTNHAVDILNKVASKELDDSNAIKKLAQILEEHLKQWRNF